MIDFELIRSARLAYRKAQFQIGDPKQYVNSSYPIMYNVYMMLKQKQAEKFIEKWVANLVGGKIISKKDASFEFSKKDIGDIQISNGPLVVTKNNVELKCIFQENNLRIGGGQFRFYEPIGGYLFFKAFDENYFEMYLLSKDQLIQEIKQRAINSGRSAYCSSQGSNDINGSTDEKLKRLDENVAGLRSDKISWGFNIKTEKKYYDEFKAKYYVTPEDVKKRNEI